MQVSVSKAVNPKSIKYNAAEEKIPDTRRLFESVEGFVETEDFAWKSRVYKPFWLKDINVESLCP
jgi:hypothetical protein